MSTKEGLTLQELVDEVMRRALDGRPRPQCEREQLVRGNITAMGAVQVRNLIANLDAKVNGPIFPMIIGQLYGTGVHVAAQAA